MEKFVWDDKVRVVEKVDGSLVLLYKYHDVWHVNTRGSFGGGELAFTGKSWSEWIWGAFPRLDQVELLDANHTYVMEFVSPYNKVVRYYPLPQLYLLAVIETKTGEELPDEAADAIADRLGVQRPNRFSLKNAEAIQKFLKENAEVDPTFEGFVLIDRNHNRIKFKSETYVNLHHLVDNGNLFNPSRLVPLVLNGERDEVVSYLPEIAEHFDRVEKVLNSAFADLMKLWESVCGIESQKDFALSIVGRTSLSSILFRARKEQRHPKDIWSDCPAFLVKVLFKQGTEIALGSDA